MSSQLNFMLTIWSVIFLRNVDGKFQPPCVPFQSEGSAYEIIAVVNCSVYMGIRPDNQSINQDLFRTLFDEWSPSGLWIKNTAGLRFTTFNQTCLFSSPGYSEKVKHHISAGEPWEPINWIYLANFCVGSSGMGGCFPESCQGLRTKDGSLRYTELSKCHYMYVCIYL